MKDQPSATKTSYRRRKTKNLYAVFALVIFVVAIVAVSKITSSRSSQHLKAPPVAIVHITKTGFEPATLVVKQGTKVIWTNTDTGMHQVASNPYPKDTGLPGLKSEILNNAQTYTYTANTAGSFGYHDQLAPTTNGTLVVEKK